MKSLFLFFAAALLAGCTTLRTQIVIDAPPAAVRSALFDFAAYPAWNPFIVKVDGTVAQGNEVVVTVRPVGRPEISGRTTVVAMRDNYLSWRGSLAVPGLFHGRHEFILEPAGPGRTLLRQNERMAGLIIPFYDFKPTAAGFAAMNEALKARVEQAAR